LKDFASLSKLEHIRSKVTPLYTNRSLSFHMINKQKEALNDADYVLNNLDSKNMKMLFRRAHANKQLGNYEHAIRDLQVLSKNEPGDQQYKVDLNDCMTMLVDEQKKKKQ
jgi:tetratricopeptide (TPR) repeat protein